MTLLHTDFNLIRRLYWPDINTFYWSWKLVWPMRQQTDSSSSTENLRESVWTLGWYLPDTDGREWASDLWFSNHQLSERWVVTNLHIHQSPWFSSRGRALQRSACDTIHAEYSAILFVQKNLNLTLESLLASFKIACRKGLLQLHFRSDLLHRQRTFANHEEFRLLLRLPQIE